MIECYCLCEFQCIADSGEEHVALWHPVSSPDGGNFSRVLEQSSEFMIKMRPAIKATYVALQIGVVAARIAGVPVPNLASLIPEDALNVGKNIIDLGEAAGIKKDDIIAKATGVKDFAIDGMKDEPSISALKAKTGKSGDARRPAPLKGESLLTVQALFGPEHVRCIAVKSIDALTH